MKINPNDPYFPSEDPGTGEAGVTIHLHVAESAMQGWLSTYRQSINEPSPVQIKRPDDISDWAHEMADAMIERANREE